VTDDESCACRVLRNNEWGATPKAERLSRHSRFDIESRSAELKSSRFARGKSNFDIRTSEQHKSVSFTNVQGCASKRRIGIGEWEPTASIECIIKLL
jgi:hypothetical protein